MVSSKLSTHVCVKGTCFAKNHRRQSLYFLPLHSILTVGKLTGKISFHEYAWSRGDQSSSHVTIKYSSLQITLYWDFLTQNRTNAHVLNGKQNLRYNINWRCSNKECCKQCRYVMFKGTMTKWPVQKLTQGTTQKLLQHHDATDI